MLHNPQGDHAGWVRRRPGDPWDMVAAGDSWERAWFELKRLTGDHPDADYIVLAAGIHPDTVGGNEPSGLGSQSYRQGGKRMNEEVLALVAGPTGDVGTTIDLTDAAVETLTALVEMVPELPKHLLARTQATLASIVSHLAGLVQMADYVLAPDEMKTGEGRIASPPPATKEVSHQGTVPLSHTDGANRNVCERQRLTT